VWSALIRRQPRVLILVDSSLK